MAERDIHCRSSGPDPHTMKCFRYNRFSMTNSLYKFRAMITVLEFLPDNQVKAPIRLRRPSHNEKVILAYKIGDKGNDSGIIDSQWLCSDQRAIGKVVFLSQFCLGRERYSSQIQRLLICETKQYAKFRRSCLFSSLQTDGQSFHKHTMREPK